MKTQDLTEFSSGIEYDAQYAQHYDEGIEFIKRQIQAIRAHSLLDVCCGSGIVTIPVSENLKCTVGIDISKGMLEHAERKAIGRDNLRFFHQDATQFSLGKQFDLAIMTGNAFQAFLDDDMLRGVLDSLSIHLRQGGRFVFDTRLPTSENLCIDDEMALWQTYLSPAFGEVKYMGMCACYDQDTSIMYLKKERHLEDGRCVPSSIDLKYRSLGEIHSFLECSGFTVIAKYRSWSEQEFTSDSCSLICVAEKI